MKNKSIFLVDDDEMLSQMLSDRLSKNPLNTITIFATGEACIEQLQQHPDVVILDYHLNTVNPEAKNGMEILQQIKKVDKNICVIMLSSQEQYGKAMQTIIKGALEYVVKGNDAFKKIEEILASLD